MQVQVQTETGLLPAPAALSREVDNLAVLYGDSSDDTWRALAFKVNQVNRRIDYITNLPTLAPNETLDFGYCGDDGHSEAVASPGNDQLRVGSNVTETLVEYGVGVTPGGLLVGVQNPAGQTITGVQDADRLRGFGPENANGAGFEDFGAVRSEFTTTEQGMPTTALSPSRDQGLLRFEASEQDRNNIYFGFKNTREDDAAPSLFAWGKTYRVSAVQSEQAVRNIVFGNGVNRRVLTYGGLSNTSPKRPSDWKPHEVTLTGDDARAALNGGSN